MNKNEYICKNLAAKLIKYLRELHIAIDFVDDINMNMATVDASWQNSISINRDCANIHGDNAEILPYSWIDEDTGEAGLGTM